MTDDDKDDKPHGRGQHPNSLANLRPHRFQGAISNPKGRPPQWKQNQALIAEIGDGAKEAFDVVRQIMRKTRIGPGDDIRLRAANSILDRHIGKAPQSVSASIVQRTVGADGTIIEGSMSGGMSPLLQQAHAHLAQERVHKLAPPSVQDQPAAPALPDVILMPPPSPTASSVQIPEAATTLCSVADCTKPVHANGFCNVHNAHNHRHGDPVLTRGALGRLASAANVEPAPAASVAEGPPAPEPRRPSDFPEFDRFSAEKARTLQADQERAKKVEQARAEGRPQISAAEAFPPDPREPPEIVNFTLAGGGRIKRC